MKKDKQTVVNYEEFKNFFSENLETLNEYEKTILRWKKIAEIFTILWCIFFIVIIFIGDIFVDIIPGIIMIIITIIWSFFVVKSEVLCITYNNCVDKFCNIFIKKLMNVKSDLYVVKDELYDKNIDKNPVFKIFKFNKILLKNKIVRNDGNVTFADLKLIKRTIKIKWKIRTSPCILVVRRKRKYGV